MSKGKYIVKNASKFVYSNKGEQFQIKGFGIFNTETGSFINLDIDNDKVKPYRPYVPVGGRKVCLDIVETINNGSQSTKQFVDVKHLKVVF
jgi:hypothetical protein